LTSYSQAFIVLVIDPVQSQQILSELSFELHIAHEAHPSGEVFPRILVEHILQHARSTWEPWTGPRHFLTDIAIKSSIFYPVDPVGQSYRYMHRTFREFLAASRIAEAPEEARDQILTEVEKQPGWAEVLVFLAGLVSDDQKYLMRIAGQSEDIALRALKEVKSLDPRLALNILQLHPTSRGDRRILFYRLEERIGSGDLLVDLLWTYLKSLKGAVPRFDLYFVNQLLSRQGSSIADQLRAELFTFLPPPSTDMFDVRRDPVAGQYWCNVKGGECIVGADPDDPLKPHWVPAARMVYISDFEIAQVPITNHVYACFDPNFTNPTEFSGLVSDDELSYHPVVNVSWYEAEAFCMWARQAVPDLRLPTEYEWEKAAGWDPVAKRVRRFPWGDDWDPSRLNSWEQGPNMTTRVGSYARGASPCGALDMLGNVWEWCLDWFADEPWRGMSEMVRDPAGPVRGERRVDRGGGWYHDVGRPTCYIRAADTPSDIFAHCGFRVVRSRVNQGHGYDL
jgi:formylglycine-generating enzyme required for sulfatase activity